MAYLWLLQPLILKRMTAASQQNQIDWLIGLLVLCVPLFEISGFVLKRPVSAYLALHYPRTDASPWGLVAYLFTVMFHVGSAVLLVIIGFQFLQIGFNEHTPDGMQFLLFLVLMLNLAKEAFLIVAGVPNSTNFTQQLYRNKILTAQDRIILRWMDKSPLKQITERDALQNLVGEVCLLISSAVLFTALWDFMLRQSPIYGKWPTVIFEYLGLTIFFGWIFLSARTVSIMEGLVIQSTANQRRWTILSGAAIWLITMLTLPRN